ncbi:MAG: primosomal protein N' [Clostridia bacterium]|nr:primosomal protein N' [Clostridia bacterium]
MGIQRIAKVRLFAVTRATDREFDYLCPQELPAFRGCVVRVPFGKGNRERYGVVCSLREEEPKMALKSVLDVLDKDISLTEEMMALCEHLREQIFCTFGEAARAILPSPVYKKEAKKLRFVAAASGLCPETALGAFRGKNKDTYQKFIDWIALVGSAPEKQCKELFGMDGSAFSLLAKKGLITLYYDEVERDPFLGLSGERTQGEPLSEEQERAFRALREMSDEGKAVAALLHGVTGSGKTRVMLALCDHVLSKGKTVLYLVPEIALTGQSARLLFGRYGDQVAIIHSALSEGERRDTYAAIRSGRKRIVLGTRSAVFAPVDSLGLVVMDEEQDTSYKSDTQLKYHARDVARFRCAKNSAMLLLASATPDVESYYKASVGIYRLVSLTERYGTATLPEVRIVDLRPDLRREPGALIGRFLSEEIRQNLEKGEQTILLMNRRGYRRFVSCMDCASVIRCPHCSVSMTLHNTSSKRLSCHYCGWAIPLPETCPECGSSHLVPHGYGIQQLEEELQQRFPEARLIRMDSDTMNAKGSHEALLESFRKKEADILIGTQMVAKGHNFPEVTLVGIVMADSSLYLSDFRAAEHSFSLLTQVIGRAGRAEKKGRAVIQTLNPAHNVFSLASEQNYPAFYEGEIALRRAFQFPPFCQLAVLTLSHEKESEVLRKSAEAARLLEENLKGEFSDVAFIVYGPFEAPVYRVKNVYRKRFIIKYKNNARSRALFNRILLQLTDSDKSGVGIALDIGPGLI